MSIVTKTGDQGMTSLWSGERIWKDDMRVEAYGCIDELSSFLGLARHSCRQDTTQSAIEQVQRCLVRVAGELASRGQSFSNPLSDRDELELTAAIEALEAQIALSGFVVPGMTPGSAALDVARTVCRRAERRVVTLSREVEVSGSLCRWLNRLSDYLFMLARAEEVAEGKMVYV